MTDYKSPLNRNPLIEFEDDRESNPIATAFWLVVFIAASCLMGYILVNAVIKEAENQEKYLGRPQAFRKASPTHEQMWALDHLTNVSKVAHAERQQP